MICVITYPYISIVNRKPTIRYSSVFIARPIYNTYVIYYFRVSEGGHGMND